VAEKKYEYLTAADQLFAVVSSRSLTHLHSGVGMVCNHPMLARCKVEHIHMHPGAQNL